MPAKMSETRFRHPLTRWQFAGAWLFYAFAGAWGRLELMTTLLALVPPIVKASLPQYHAKAVLFLGDIGAGEAWLWKLPLVVGGAIFVVRLLVAPFVIYRDKPSGDKPEPEIKLYFDAGITKLPTRTIGIEGGVYEIIFGDPERIGWAHTQFAPNSNRAMQWPTDGGRELDAIKCRVTSYNDFPVTNIVLVFAVTVKKSIRTANLEIVGGNQYSEGEVLVQGDLRVTIAKIDGLGTIEFYIFQSRDVFVTVVYPKSAAAEVLNHTVRQTVQLPKRFPNQEILFNVANRQWPGARK